MSDRELAYIFFRTQLECSSVTVARLKGSCALVDLGSCEGAARARQAAQKGLLSWRGERLRIASSYQTQLTNGELFEATEIGPEDPDYKEGADLGSSEFGIGRTENCHSGDWICPSCESDNFNKRTSCRICHEPKPPIDMPVAVRVNGIEVRASVSSVYVGVQDSPLDFLTQASVTDEDIAQTFLPFSNSKCVIVARYNDTSAFVYLGSKKAVERARLATKDLRLGTSKIAVYDCDKNSVKGTRFKVKALLAGDPKKRIVINDQVKEVAPEPHVQVDSIECATDKSFGDAGGDWICSNCNFDNFRRRSYCKKCQTPRDISIDNSKATNDVNHSLLSVHQIEVPHLLVPSLSKPKHS